MTSRETPPDTRAAPSPGAPGDFPAILRAAVQQRASDIHLVTGLPPVLRIDGELHPTTGSPLRPGDVTALASSVLSPAQWEQFEQERELCVSLILPNAGHFRLTLYLAQGNVEAAVRVVPLSARAPDELGLPEVIHKLVERPSGLVLVTGPTGSGKTTTFNCLLNLINRQRRCKIITVEDPIEYVHQNCRSIIVQQQVHSDTRSFSRALTHILRQDPDVIGVGEMRDLDTIATAITAAETGHLVIATLHTPDAVQTVDRIVDAFPGDRQQQVMVQLAACLQAVVAQQLLPRIDGTGRVLATEVLVANTAVRTLLRERRMVELRSTLEMGRAEGMHTMDRSLRELYGQGVIALQTALAHAQNPELIQQSTGPPARKK